MAFLNKKQLLNKGFRELGKNVLISDKVSVYGAENIIIADNVRIDDFCVLSAGVGGVYIGSNVHIAVGCLLVGDAKITLNDFVGLSSRVSIYSSTDDYSGKTLTNPTVPSEYKNVFSDNVELGRHVIIGSGSVVLPGVSIGEGSAIGALSMVSRNISDWTIASGVPAKRIKERKKDLLLLEEKYKNEKK